MTAGGDHRPGFCMSAGRANGLRSRRLRNMANVLRGCLAGWGASKLGGGCLSTILIFFLLYWLLGVVF